MSAAKKVYPQAVLKNLSKEKQAAIIEYCDGSDGVKGHSLQETVAWLRADGISTNAGSVSQWRSWYLLQRQMELNEAAVNEVVKTGREQGWLKSAEEEQLAGQAFFNRMAIEQQDLKSWFFMQRLNLQKEQLALDRDKVEILTCEKFLLWSKDKKARDIAESNLSNGDKIQALRQTYYADVEELEKSGEVKLPQ
jgi:hypothetical protein